MERLLRCRADPCIVARGGQTALQIAAERGIELAALWPLAGEASRGFSAVDAAPKPPESALSAGKRKWEGEDGGSVSRKMPRTTSCADNASACVSTMEEALLEMGRSARRDDVRGVCRGLLSAESSETDAEGAAAVQVRGLEALLELLPAGGYDWNDTQRALLRVMHLPVELQPIQQCSSAPSPHPSGAGGL